MDLATDIYSEIIIEAERREPMWGLKVQGPSKPLFLTPYWERGYKKGY